MRRILVSRGVFDFFTLGILAGLPLGKDQKNDYVKKLMKVTNSEEHRFLFEHFYMNLDALDNKTNTMMQFMSVVVGLYSAAIVFLISRPSEKITTWLIAGAAMAYAAGILFISIQTVHWSPATEVGDRALHAAKLLRIRDRRTIRFRLGWLLSIASSLILSYAVISLAFRYLGAS